MSSNRRSSEFVRAQREHFGAADVDQFRWTTEAPGIASSEDELLALIADDLRSPCLEVGCGEGNNIARLVRSEGVRLVGIDRFPAKLHFAASEFAGVRFACAEATALPFADASFRCVLVRDLLHHVPEPQRVLNEVVRVLGPGGRFVLLEPNGRNPLIRLQSHLVAAEAGARDSSRNALDALLRAQPLIDVCIEAAQPLALRRLLFHYRMGAPRLAKSATLRALASTAERALGLLLPRSAWTYVVARARRAGPGVVPLTPSQATGSCP